MKTLFMNPVALMALFVATTPLCQANDYAMSNESAFTASYSIQEETGDRYEIQEQTGNRFELLPATRTSRKKMASAGGGDAAGGNFVEEEILDEYENKGVKELSQKEVNSIAAPALERIKHLVPGFAAEFLAAGRNVKWRLDPKPLNQKLEACRNITPIEAKTTIRACQSDIEVRIDKGFYDQYPTSHIKFVVHEKLQYIRKRSQGKISDDKVRELYRAIMSAETTPDQLKETLARTGFGSFQSSRDIENARLAKIKEAQEKRELQQQIVKLRCQLIPENCKAISAGSR